MDQVRNQRAKYGVIKEPESPIWHNYGIQSWVVVKIMLPFGVLSIIRVIKEPESPIWHN